MLKIRPVLSSLTGNHDLSKGKMGLYNSRISCGKKKEKKFYDLYQMRIKVERKEIPRYQPHSKLCTKNLILQKRQGNGSIPARI